MESESGNDRANPQQGGQIHLDLSNDCAAVDDNGRLETPQQQDLCRVIQSVREVISCCACFSSDTCMRECTNGHLICHSCFLTIRQDNRPQCPTCRVALFPDSKRSLTAHKVLSELPDICLQCNKAMLNKELTGHRLNSCSKRRVTCGLSPLGCSWCGVAEDYAEHYKECEVRKNFQERPIELNLSNMLTRFRRRDQMIKETFTCFAALFRHLEGFELQTVLIPLTTCKTDANSVAFKSDQFYGGYSRWVIDLTVNFGEENQDDGSAACQISDLDSTASEIQPRAEIRERISLSTSANDSTESILISPQHRGNSSSYRQRKELCGELTFTARKENSHGFGRMTYAFIPLQVESAETGAQINFRPLISTHRFLNRGERTPEFIILPMRWRHLSSLRELLHCRLLNLEIVIGRKMAEEVNERT